MQAKQLLEGVRFRFGEHSAPLCSELEIKRVCTAVESDMAHALFVCYDSAIHGASQSVLQAYQSGCRLFLSRVDICPGEQATVLLAQEPQALLGTLAARLYGYPARHLTVVGITGNAGKTTTLHMLAHLMRAAGRTVGSISSFGCAYGNVQLPPSPIVPDAAQIQAMLRDMVTCGVEVALIELSAYQLTHCAHKGIDFTALLLADIFPREHDGTPQLSQAACLSAYADLLAAPCAITVLPVGATLQAAALRTLRVGEGGEISAALCEGCVLDSGAYGTRVTLCMGDEKREVRLPALGEGAVQSALSATGMAMGLGVALPVIAQALSAPVSSAPFYCAYQKNRRAVYITAAFRPQDIAAELSALREHAEGRVCVLLGSVGGRAKGRRALLAKMAECYADFVYLSADDPDDERPEAICLDMLHAMHEPERAAVIPDRRTAIQRAVRELRAGDVLLLAGKGGVPRQLVRGRYEAFDEAEIVRAAFVT